MNLNRIDGLSECLIIIISRAYVVLVPMAPNDEDEEWSISESILLCTFQVNIPAMSVNGDAEQETRF